MTLRKLRVLNIADITIHFKVNQKKEVANGCENIINKTITHQRSHLVPCGTQDLKEEEEDEIEKNLAVFAGRVVMQQTNIISGKSRTDEFTP